MLFLFLDYDGTLTGFRREPMDAVLSGRMRNVLQKLAQVRKIPITVVSGRDIENLLKLSDGLEHLNINWSGAHGIQIRFRGSNKIILVRSFPDMADLENKISAIIGQNSCFSIENKQVSFAVHYRKCPGSSLYLLDRINKLINEYKKDKPIEALHMKKVIEIKPSGVNKGNIINAILSHYKRSGNILSICIGDDVTDEYLFRANRDGINIKVGYASQSETAACYYLNGVQDVYWFLKKIYRLSYVFNSQP